MNPHIEPAKPHRMQNQMKHVEPLRRIIHHEVPPHHPHPPLHPYILPRRDPRQNLLQVRDVSDRNLHRERLPVEDVAERQGVIVADRHGHALEIHRLDDARARHLVAARAEAELAPPHHVVVGDPPREVFGDSDVAVLVLPVLQQERPDGAVVAAREEGEDRAAGGRRPPEHPRGRVGLEVDLREGDVFRRVESLRRVRVAEHADGVGEQMRIRRRDVRPLPIDAMCEEFEFVVKHENINRKENYCKLHAF